MDVEHPQAMVVAVNAPSSTSAAASTSLNRGGVSKVTTSVPESSHGASYIDSSIRCNSASVSNTSPETQTKRENLSQRTSVQQNHKMSSYNNQQTMSNHIVSYNGKQQTARYTMPSVLKQVLQDVARSGSCLNLHWTKQQQWQFQNTRSNTTSSSASSVAKHSSTKIQSGSIELSMYPCLKDALREALAYVLDAAYDRAGYIDTTVARISNNTTSSLRSQRSRYLQGHHHQQIFQQQQKQLTTSAFSNQNKLAFLDRRMRLLAMLPHDDDNNETPSNHLDGVVDSSDIVENKICDLNTATKNQAENHIGSNGSANRSNQSSSLPQLGTIENNVTVVTVDISEASSNNLNGDMSKTGNIDQMSGSNSIAGSSVGTDTILAVEMAEETSSACSSVTSQLNNVPQHLRGASNNNAPSSGNSTVTSTTAEAGRSGQSAASTKTGNSGQNSASSPPTPGDEGPPFTIQRLAEVLIAPEFYYTQTHKLCNGLEKLLLVTSSVTAFGGGGLDDGLVSSSEREMAALADEKGREQQRKFKRKLSGTSEKSGSGQGSGNKDSVSAQQQRAQQIRKRQEYMRHQTARLQMAEAMEPAHPSSPPHPGGIDGGNGNGGTGSPPTSPHSPVSAFNNVRRGNDDRDVAHYHGGDEDLADTGVIDHESFRAALRERYVISDDGRAAARAPSPPASPPTSPLMGGRRNKFGKISSSDSDQGTMQDNERTRNLSITRTPSPILYARSALSMEQSNDASDRSHAAQHLSPQILQHQQLDFDDLDHSGAAHNPSNVSGSTDVGDLEVEPSKSNSSVSSDGSEDDDSLSSDRSDRSDGSESAGYYEPITAARVMALNRMQQQQRREQILQNRALAAARGHRFHPPPDSEYQSGDSIDSMKAYDSDGSESSSSV